MSAAWLAHARRLGPFDAAIVGSDPAFAPLVGPGLRRLWPTTALVHWCFDVYPEAIAAEGALVFTKARELGLEGIVSKRAGSFYKSGRCRNWLKTRNPDFVRAATGS